jgi:hypothetical protein
MQFMIRIDAALDGVRDEAIRAATHPVPPPQIARSL